MSGDVPEITRYLNLAAQGDVEAERAVYPFILEELRRLAAASRRRLPEIRNGSQMARAAAERMAVNMPIQGTSADIIKIAMINIDREIRDRGLKSRMIIQVHDELIFEVAPGELMEVQALASELMPSAMELSVPLEVEIKTGPTWGDME